MADVFFKEDVSLLLKDKYVLYIGDSNVRALYKDLIWILKTNSIIDVGILKRRVSKLEESFLGDKLVARSKLTRGRDFTEHRVYEGNNVKIEFLFVTRCYSNNLEKLFDNFKSGKTRAPDVVYMNSCLWDVCRWGPNGVKNYKTDIVKLMKLLCSSLPSSSLFIWGTALPTASQTSGGLIVKQIDFLQAALRIHVIEANKYISSLVASYGYDVLDSHYYMQYQITRRSADGIHFLPPAVRFITNLFLTHISLSWDVKLPERLKENTFPLENQIKLAMDIPVKNVDKIVRKMDALANNLSCSIQPAVTPSKKKKRKKRKSMNLKTVNRIDVPKPQRVMKEGPTKPISPQVFSRKATNTPPFYEKGKKKQGIPNCTCPTPPTDFRLLGFNDFSPNNSLQVPYSRYGSQYNQNHYQANHWSTNLLEQLKKIQRGALMYANVCNYYNDPYNMSYYQQRESYGSQAQSSPVGRTVYNVPAYNNASYDNRGYYTNTYYTNDNQPVDSYAHYNNYNQQISHGYGPIRNRNRPANHYYNPYRRGNNRY